MRHFLFRESSIAGFAIRAIAREVSTEVRSTLRAPGYGHPVHRELARGTGPCRACLSTFVVGKDERLLFTFNPFSGSAHLAQPGPVFIHVNECQSARSDVYPQGLRGLPVVVEVHYTDGTTSAPRALTDGNEAGMLASLRSQHVGSATGAMNG